MIRLSNPSDCCGCGACASLCPKHSITMRRDAEGFLYPEVNHDSCIDCHLCERRCPIINAKQSTIPPLQVSAMRNKDKGVVYDSSSGGLFYSLAQKVISEGGYVYGVVLSDNLKAVHRMAYTEQELHAMLGSKYIQSEIGDSYISCKKILDAGQQVLFTGVGCQIAGLKAFLGKDYDNLITVEVACHGVPSPKVYEKYIKALERNGIVSDFNFRDKCSGWEEYSVSWCVDGMRHQESRRNNIYLRAFLSDLILRPSCHQCRFKNFTSRCDILLGDLWGTEYLTPQFADDKGTSMCCIFAERGQALYEKIASELEFKSILLDDIVKYNPCLVASVSPHRKRDWFFARLDKSEDVISLINRAFTESFFDKMRNRFHNLFLKITEC